MLADAEAPRPRHAGEPGAIDPPAQQVVCASTATGADRRAPAAPLGVEVDPDAARVRDLHLGLDRPAQGRRDHATARWSNLLAAHARAARARRPTTCVANVTTPAFDLSVPDWYLPLTTGAKLVIVPREATLDGVELADWLARTGRDVHAGDADDVAAARRRGLEGQRDAEDRLRRRGAPARARRASCVDRGASLGTCTGRPRRRSGRRCCELGPGRRAAAARRPDREHALLRARRAAASRCRSACRASSTSAATASRAAITTGTS